MVMKRINIELKPADHGRAKAIAAATGKPFETYLREALEAHIRKETTE